MFTFQLIMTTTTTTVNWVKILAIFQPNLGTWAIIGEFDNFGQICKLLNIILAQFMDWNQSIVIYYYIAVHQLGQNYI